MRKLLLGISAILLVSCAANIKSSFTEQRKPLTIENKVAFLDLENKIPENANKLELPDLETADFLQIVDLTPT